MGEPAPIQILPPVAIDRTRIVDLLDRIEHVDEAATGALVFGPAARPVGTVLVEDGRICWAVTAGMNRRLTDLLRAQTSPPLSAEAIQQVYQKCRNDDVPLGEALVVSGLVTPDGLRAALREHTAEAIGHLSELPTVACAWNPHKNRRYDARYTFSPAEILIALESRNQPGLTETIQEDLEQVMAPGSLGFCFARATPYPMLLAAVGAERLGAREIAGLGRWTIDMLDLRQAIDANADIMSFSTRAGTAACAWNTGRVVTVVLCEDESSLIYTIVRRRRILRGET